MKTAPFNLEVSLLRSTTWRKALDYLANEKNVWKKM